MLLAHPDPSARHGARSFTPYPICVAPPASKALSDTVPFRIFVTNPLFSPVGWGTRHVDASYLSMQTVPAGTESRGHFRNGLAHCDSAGAATRTNATVAAVAGASQRRVALLEPRLSARIGSPAVGPRPT